MLQEHDGNKELLAFTELWNSVSFANFFLCPWWLLANEDLLLRTFQTISRIKDERKVFHCLCFYAVSVVLQMGILHFRAFPFALCYFVLTSRQVISLDITFSKLELCKLVYSNEQKVNGRTFIFFVSWKLYNWLLGGIKIKEQYKKKSITHIEYTVSSNRLK